MFTMFDSLSNGLLAQIPAATFVIPFIGDVDGQRLNTAVLLFVGITALCWFIRLVVLVRLRYLAEKTNQQFDDTVVTAIESVRPWVYSVIALYAALTLYELPSAANLIVSGLLYTTFVWQGIQIAKCFLRYVVTKFIEKDEDGDGVVDPAAGAAADMITMLATIVLWLLGALLVLSNLGIEVTSLLAGLGIGGIAVAFALQGVLSDLFASFSIYFDKPFRVGDFVVLGADSGTVERIGIKSTRIRTLQGEELVVSNTELTTARVQNFKKMNERRISSQFGITYETPQEKVAEINGVVERIFEDISTARLDRVHFINFGDSALIFELVYYIESAEYADYLAAQQQFNFTLMERFAEMGVEFAYPTQTVYHKAIG